MGLIVVVALMLTALRQTSPLAASLIWTGTLTLLTIAALIAVLDPRRTFFVGFALVGLIFAAFASWPYDYYGAPILTSRMSTFLFNWIRDGNTSVAKQVFFHGYPFRPATGADEIVRFLAFHRIGDSVAALLHGTAGGILALFLHSRLRRDAESKPEP